MKATSTPPLKLLKIKYPPQETDVLNWKVAVLHTLKSIREDKEPAQERKQLSLKQKYVMWVPEGNMDRCSTGSESETGKGTGKEDTQDVGKRVVREKVGGRKVSSNEIKS